MSDFDKTCRGHQLAPSFEVVVDAIALAAPLDASAQQQFPATLAGHGVLPALAIALDPPKDAPEAFAIAGKYTGPEWRRVDAIETIPGTSYISPASAPRRTGTSTPFKGQPMQGFSGIKAMADGTFWVMTDNGFGAKKDSGDALLMFHHIRPDWKAGTVQHLRSVFLHDPDRKIPFLIVNEGTQKRYLTGADLDIESIQATKRVTAVRISESIVVDGALAIELQSASALGAEDAFADGAFVSPAIGGRQGSLTFFGERLDSLLELDRNARGGAKTGGRVGGDRCAHRLRRCRLQDPGRPV